MIDVKLKDITLNITDGKHGDCKNESNSGFYFISCKDVHDGEICYDNARQITEKDFIETNRRTMLEPNDILVTNSGTIGRMALVKDVPRTYRTTFQKSVAIIKPNQEIVRPSYLYYSLINYVTQFINESNGAAQKNLLLGTMRQFKIKIEEDFEKQDRIANILLFYDRLIENNQKQIKLLEETAQRLYKEWFVDLHFPGYENVEIVDGVPEGWNETTLDDFIELKSGYAFKSSLFDDIGKYKIATIKNVQDGAFNGENVNKIMEIPSKMPNYCKLYEGDTLLSLTGNVGRICTVIGNNYLLNQRVAKIISDYPCFAYYLFKSRKMFHDMNNLANGAAQQNLSPIRTGQMKILKPNNDIILMFEKAIRPLKEKKVLLSRGIITLKETRDRLLPKLMSGEIEV